MPTTRGPERGSTADAPYRRRIVDEELDELLAGLPAIAVDGPKAVGKTATALRRAATVYRLDDEAERVIAQADPARLIEGERPILIDEWQRLPESFDRVRRAVDGGAPPGSFLLTGSASPSNPPTHSGAGRIVRVRLRPMTLMERGVGSPTVSLGELLEGGRPEIGGRTDVDLERYVDEISIRGSPACAASRPACCGRNSTATWSASSIATSRRWAATCDGRRRCAAGCRPTRRQRLHRPPTRRSERPRPTIGARRRRRRRPSPTAMCWSGCGSSTRYRPGCPRATGWHASQRRPNTTSQTRPWPPACWMSTQERCFKGSRPGPGTARGNPAGSAVRVARHPLCARVRAAKRGTDRPSAHMERRP